MDKKIISEIIKDGNEIMRICSKQGQSITHYQSYRIAIEIFKANLLNHPEVADIDQVSIGINHNSTILFEGLKDIAVMLESISRNVDQIGGEIYKNKQK